MNGADDPLAETIHCWSRIPTRDGRRLDALLVGYLCHTHGPQTWLVDGGAVQAHNVPWAAVHSMGESWHNNHHAFPASARHGLYPGQIELGFRFVELLARMGLAWGIQTPETLPPRPGITPAARDAMPVFVHP